MKLGAKTLNLQAPKAVQMMVPILKRLEEATNVLGSRVEGGKEISEYFAALNTSMPFMHQSESSPITLNMGYCGVSDIQVGKAKKATQRLRVTNG